MLSLDPFENNGVTNKSSALGDTPVYHAGINTVALKIFWEVIK